MDKLLKVAATGKLSSDAGRAALSHRPDLDQLMPLEDGDGEGAGRRGKDNAGDGVYRPPKLQAAHYEEERGKKAEDKKARQVRTSHAVFVLDYHRGHGRLCLTFFCFAILMWMG